MDIVTEAQGQLIKVSPANLGSRKTSKIRIVVEVEHTRQRWDALGRLLDEAEVVTIKLSGEPVQPELDGTGEPQEATLDGMGDGSQSSGEGA